jgi:hypothetical protein
MLCASAAAAALLHGLLCLTVFLSREERLFILSLLGRRFSSFR